MTTYTEEDRGAVKDDNDTCWEAIERRDADFDGRFVYAVVTTEIYCRPSCPSRQALRRNVRFFRDGKAASRHGFRACLRCQPDAVGPASLHFEAMVRACRLIDTSDQMPSLESLADSAGLSRSHFHRTFKRVIGVSPRAYGAERRAIRVRDQLAAGRSVTEALYSAGYNASSRFYEETAERLGMRPSDYRAGGEGERIRFAIAETSIGALAVAATGRGVCSIEFGEDPDILLRRVERRFPKAELIGGDAKFEALVASICGYVESPHGALELPLDVRGTAFQQRVWSALRQIPAGKTVSYADIAEAIGQPTASRAVARACATNPIAVAIPCHRVVRKDGGVSGYRWGVERKKTLLFRERDQSQSRNPS